MFTSKVKIGIGLVAAIFVIGFVYTYLDRGQQVQKLGNEAAVSKSQVSGLNATIETQKSSAEITDKRTEAGVQKAVTIAETVKNISTETDKKVQAVKEAFAVKSKEPTADVAALQAQKEKRLAQINIDGLWDTFCATHRNIPSPPGCQIKQ